MVGEQEIKKLLFIDIETVSDKEKLSDLPENMQAHWQKKSKYLLQAYDHIEEEGEKLSKVYEDRAAIYAEFGKIICISVGYIRSGADGQPIMRIKSFAHDEEHQLLTDFADVIGAHFNDPQKITFCGHNIREFDIPYICRRMLIHGIPLPEIINLSGKKPWEVKHLLDTLEMWKFGDIKHYVSLDLLTTLMQVPTPKDDIDGSMVGQVYWKEKDLPRIVRYCEKDILSVANLILKLSRQPLLEEDQVIIA
jgi:DNA polymerase elongation subunit (family B)